jgi:hypothetical protein
VRFERLPKPLELTGVRWPGNPWFSFRVMSRKEIENIVTWVLKFILELIITHIISTICYYTGEYILYILTFGNKKPNKVGYKGLKPLYRVLCTGGSVFIGFSFWIFAIGWTARVISYYLGT